MEIKKEYHKGLLLTCYSGIRFIEMEIMTPVSYLFFFFNDIHFEQEKCRQCQSIKHEVKDCFVLKKKSFERLIYKTYVEITTKNKEKH